MMQTFLRFLAACVLILTTAPLLAQEEVRIGVLNDLSKPEMLTKWQPLATALTKAIPGYHFTLVVYEPFELNAAVAARQIDFVFTNPASYLLMSHRSGLSPPLATLSNIENGQIIKSSGGTIITRSDRSDIRSLQDIQGKTVAATSSDSLGGYVVQAYELAHAGVSMPEGRQLLMTELPHENVVEAVMSRIADVGFVRSGVIERMAREGKLDPASLNIINPQQLHGISVQLSTRLYPEWAFAALPQTNKNLMRDVTAYLLTMHDDKKLMDTLQIDGFDVPADYTSVEEMLSEMRMPPFDVEPIFSLRDVFLHYRWQLLTAQAVLLIILLLSFNLYRVNRKLKAERNLVLKQSHQLRESNKLFDSILNNIPSVVFLKHASDLSMKFINRSGELIMGRNRDQLLGVDGEHPLPQIHASSVIRYDLDVLQQNEMMERDEEVIDKSGLTRIFHTKKLTLHDEEGNPQYLLGISDDITEQQQADAAIQRASRSFATLSEVNRNLVHATDELSLLNAVCWTIVEQLGYRMVWVGYLEQDADKSIRPIAQAGFEDGYLENIHISWDDNEHGRGTTGRAARTGQMLIAQNIQADETMRPWRTEAAKRSYSSCISLPLNHEDKVFGVLTIYSAQPNSFDTEEAAMLFELANDLAFGIRSLKARIERDAALQQLRVTARDLAQANAQIEQERAQLAERVTERTDQLQQANKAKDAFLATMSHEIRTPLGGLLGMIEMLGLTKLTDEQIEMLSVAQNSGKSLLRIVDDILDWSKIEAGKLELASQTVSIQELMRDVATTFAGSSSAKGIVMQYSFDDRLSAAHVCDPLRIAQILNNFTSNAIKFTTLGNVVVSADLLTQQGEYEEVRFSVKDSGIGIDHEHLTRLFQHYEQASADTARMYGGTGLGLSICRRLADLMDGQISVVSTPGEGSTFSFTVKLLVADESAQNDVQLRAIERERREKISNATPLSAHGEPAHILVVDDHPVNRTLLKHQLEQLGLQVEIAAYGIVALSLWWTGKFDMVITDCHMPEMDGYELTRSIREMETQTNRTRIPIIAWTANVMSDEKERSLASGMDDLMTKPTDLYDLKAMLQKWLKPATLPTKSEPPTVPPSQQASANDVFDPDILGKITRNREVQIEFLQEFNLQNHIDLLNLQESLRSNESHAIGSTAHRIKGACRMVGALELENVCKHIELAAKQNDLENVHKHAAVLDTVAERLAQALFVFTRSS